MSPYGYIYYPNACYENATAQCKLHIYVHGCFSAIRTAGVELLMSDLEGRDMNAIAAANNLVVVYPDFQIQTGNMMGCADSMGYTGDNYRNLKSIQGQYLINVINRLKEPRDTAEWAYEWGL